MHLMKICLHILTCTSFSYMVSHMVPQMTISLNCIKPIQQLDMTSCTYCQMQSMAFQSIVWIERFFFALFSLSMITLDISSFELDFTHTHYLSDKGLGGGAKYIFD